MSFLDRAWRFPVFALALALPFAVGCADDEGAGPPTGGQPSTGTISGRVTDSETGTGIVGALVGTSPATQTGLTDNQGNYVLNNVPIPDGSATYAVTASKEGYASNSTSVSLTDASPSATANLALDPLADPTPTTGTLNVKVVDKTGTAVEDATVEVRDGDGELLEDPVETNAEGFAFFTEVPPGPYTVSASKEIGGINFKAAAGVQVNAGETAFVQLTLRRDFEQSVFPNIDGEPVELGPGSDIRFIPLSALGGSSDNDPEEDCNIIRTQHMFVVEVVNEDGDPVSGVKVQWDLNISENGTISLECPQVIAELFDDPAGCGLPTVPGNTGSVVDSDDPDLDPNTARSGLQSSFNVDTRKAVTFTNDTDQAISFGGVENVTVEAGMTWIVITSPVEGRTDVIAATSDIPNFNPDCAIDEPDACDKEFATKVWVNWATAVYELTFDDDVDTVGNPPGNTVVPVDPHDNPDANFFPIAEGSTILHVLDRKETSASDGLDDPGCLGEGAFDNSFVAGVEDECELTDNQEMFLAQIKRWRPDSPFNLSQGFVVAMVTDDVPDVEFWGEGITNGLAGGLNPPADAGCAEHFDVEDGGSNTADVCNVEANGPSDNQFAIDVSGAFGFGPRNLAAGEFDANNDIFDGGIVPFPPPIGPREDEDDFIGWVLFQIRLNPLVYYCDDDGDGDCEPATDAGDSFSAPYQTLLSENVDNTNSFRFLFINEFGEVCDEFTFKKQWVQSRLRIIKSHPDAVLTTQSETAGGPDIANGSTPRPVKTHTVEVNQEFSYTITVINDGQVPADNVRITDTLPRFSFQFCLPVGPETCASMRDGHQAFRYVTDRPAFDPNAIVYALDYTNNEGGPEIDQCIIGRDGSAAGGSYVAPEPCFVGPNPDADSAPLEAGTIAAARALAEDESASGDQVVWIQWFDANVLARQMGGESEDSVEVTLAADADLYNAAPAGGQFPAHNDIPGTWCNIATVTDGPDNLLADDEFESFDADTLCHRVVEALLEIRKTADDAVVSAGGDLIWTVEVRNNGSTAIDVVIRDTLDDGLGEDISCANHVTLLKAGATCTEIAAAAPFDGRIFEVDFGTLNPTGVFVPAYRVSIPTGDTGGIFCNRVTAVGTTGVNELTDSDISCIEVVVSIELDIANEDGILDEQGDFNSAEETFTVGELYYYELQVTNQSAFPATGVVVTDVVAPFAARFRCVQVVEYSAGTSVGGDGTPPASCAAGGFTWTIGNLAANTTVRLLFQAEALLAGDDVNRAILTADQLVNPATDEEPTTIVNP